MPESKTAKGAPPMAAAAPTARLAPVHVDPRRERLENVRRHSMAALIQSIVRGKLARIRHKKIYMATDNFKSAESKEAPSKAVSKTTTPFGKASQIAPSKSESVHDPAVQATAISTNVSQTEPALPTGLSFPQKNGYSWDLCLVFNAKEGKPAKHKDGILTYQQFIKALRLCKFDTFQFWSVQRDEIFCLVRMKLKHLKHHANAFEHMLPLDEKEIEHACTQGVEFELNGKTEKIAGFDIYDGIHEGWTTLRPYEHLFAPYSSVQEQFYRKDLRLMDGVVHPFTTIDRLKIMMHVIEGRSKGHCNINLDLQLQGPLLTFYPLHNSVRVAELKQKWLNWSIMPWRTPGELIKNYFGERIALYFLFLSHYSTWLLYSAIVGLLVTAHFIIGYEVYGSVTEALDKMYSIPIYCFFISLWTTSMLKQWKHKESMTALFWGTTEFERNEKIRPEHNGEPGRSFIDGSHTVLFSNHERIKRRRIAYVVIFLKICLVAALFAGVFYFKFYSTHISQDPWVQAYGPTIADIMNAVQIQIMSFLYQTVVRVLTDFENHKTDSEYEDSLVNKLFYFEFINSYIPSFYIAFVKKHIGDECFNGNCFLELSKLLLTLFVTNLVISNVVGRIVSKLTAMTTAYKETGSLTGKALVELSPAERDYFLVESNDIHKLISDYNQISIQYGFMTLFIGSCPFIPFLAFVMNYFEQKNDGKKMLLESRRPFPLGAQDIGSWYTIFEYISVISVFTNAAIIFDTMDIFSDQSTSFRLGVGMAFVLFSFGCRAIVGYLIPDTPNEIAIQLLRQQHIIDKVFDHKLDEDPLDNTADDDETEDLVISDKFTS